jgi:2-methylcitrate dehydratase PrpD
MPEGITAALVANARAIRFDAIPADVVTVAKTCVLDWLGCALAGSREPLTDILVTEAATHGPSSLIGRDQKTTTQWAALVNGGAGHALDFDDTHLVMSGHPTVPVLPGLLALAESKNVNGKAFLASFVAGVETECRLGALIGLGHYTLGFHSTATLGTFGAAAACAHLLGLLDAQWLHAFGIAGIEAAGLKSVFGTMSKPFQAGKASANGLLAATLASRGFTSATDIVEVAQGFAATHGGSEVDETALDRYEGRFLVRDTVFKYHASCYLTHSAMEAALMLRDRMKFGADNAEAIRVIVPPGSLAVCNIQEPQTGLEGKFSLRATVAMALCGDDTADPASFTDERMCDPALVSVRDRVEVVPSEEVAGSQARVEIQRGGAWRNGETVDVGRPAEDVDKQWSRITEKFIRLAAPVLGQDAAWRLHGKVDSLPDLGDVAEIGFLASGGR